MLVVNNNEPDPTKVVCLALHYDGLEILVGATTFGPCRWCSTSYRATRLRGRTGGTWLALQPGARASP